MKCHARSAHSQLYNRIVNIQTQFYILFHFTRFVIVCSHSVLDWWAVCDTLCVCVCVCLSLGACLSGCVCVSESGCLSVCVCVCVSESLGACLSECRCLASSLTLLVVCAMCCLARGTVRLKVLMFWMVMMETWAKWSTLLGSQRFYGSDDFHRMLRA